MKEYKTLYRSQTDSVIAGVSGGLGKYFNIDPVLFRILFVVLTFLAAGGVVAYIIFWVVMPVEPYRFRKEDPYFKKTSTMDEEQSDSEDDELANQFSPKNYKPRNDGGLIVGIILITLGGMFLISRLVPHIDFQDIWPVILIVVGLVIIAGNFRVKK